MSLAVKVKYASFVVLSLIINNISMDYASAAEELKSNDASGVSSNFKNRLKTFGEIKQALDRYKQAYGKYPTSDSIPTTKNKLNLTVNWVGFASESNLKDGFYKLIPVYLNSVPKDPRNDNIQMHQYVYISDGKDFKFIAHQPEDIKDMVINSPALADPNRPGWAYGIWTSGASKF